MLFVDGGDIEIHPLPDPHLEHHVGNPFSPMESAVASQVGC
jgi:hypothetical protein